MEEARRGDVNLNRSEKPTGDDGSGSDRGDSGIERKKKKESGTTENNSPAKTLQRHSAASPINSVYAGPSASWDERTRSTPPITSPALYLHPVQALAPVQAAQAVDSSFRPPQTLRSPPCSSKDYYYSRSTRPQERENRSL